MKRFLLYIKRCNLVLLLLIPLMAQAQVGDRRDDFAVGINAGYSMSNVGFVPKVTQGFHFGPTIGLSARYTSEKYFKTICSIYTELNYSQLGWNENIVDIYSQPVINQNTNEQDRYSRTFRYIQMPLLAHLAWGNESRGMQFFFRLGPQFGYLIGESTSTNFTLDNANIDDRGNKTIEQFSMPVENKFDYGIAGGVGAEYVHPKLGHFLLEGRYYYGLGNIYGASHADYFAKSNNTSIELHLAYLVDISKSKK